MIHDVTIHNSQEEEREPTLQDVLFSLSSLQRGFESLQSGFNSLHSRFDSLESQFESFQSGFSAFDTKVSSIFSSILKRQDTMDGRLQVIEEKTGKIELRVENMQDDLTAALAAIDTDSITLIDHAKRITKLETRRA